ncbi:MAG: ABC transporter ATP-binding protein [Agathobacter sp.]|nr:ABC transporter ATP-binding protein [Agathobacter sp.]
MSDFAIRVKNVTKMYKLYNRHRDRLIDAFGLSRGKNYREHYALKNVNFDIKKGETIGIIGTNGSGKSTILKIITGVLYPTEGEVEINGRISALLELGAGFNMEYTGIENIYLNGTMCGFSKEEIDNRLQDILDFADIGDFVHQPVKSYSSGMFVRLAFAVAINIDPEILIVDEALSVGDVFFQNKCYHKFEEFKQQGKTILFVSHDLGSINKYCDRVVLLNKGDVLAEGEPSVMIDLYKQVLVNQLGDNNKVDKNTDSSVQKNTELWRDHYSRNPDCQEYGDQLVEIQDFAILDENDMYTSSLVKGRPFKLKVKLKVNAPITAVPIATYTIRDIKGTTITGTNTMYERAELGELNPGDTKTITFSQEMNLQGGEYLLSFGCTRYESDDFQVYHRLYNVCSLTVISDKNTVGFYDMNSVVEVE